MSDPDRNSGPLLFPFWQTLLGHQAPPGAIEGEAYSYIQRAYLAVFLVCVVEFIFWGNFFFVMGFEYLEKYISLPRYITIRELIKSVLATVTAAYCLLLLAWLGGGIFPLTVAVRKFRGALRQLSSAASIPGETGPQDEKLLSWKSVCASIALLTADYLAFSNPVSPGILSTIVQPFKELGLFDYKIYITTVIIAGMAAIFAALIGLLDIAIILSPLRPVRPGTDPQAPESAPAPAPDSNQRAQSVVALIVIILIAAILTGALVWSARSVLTAACLVSGSIVIVAVLAWLIVNHDIKTAVPLLLRVPLIVLIGWVTSRLTDPIAFMDSIQERHVQYESERLLSQIYDKFLELGAPPGMQPGSPLLDLMPRGTLQSAYQECLNRAAPAKQGTAPQLGKKGAANPDGEHGSSLQERIVAELPLQCRANRFDIAFSLRISEWPDDCRKLHESQDEWNGVNSCITACQHSYYVGSRQCSHPYNRRSCSEILHSHGLDSDAEEKVGVSSGRSGLGRGWGSASCKMQAQHVGLSIIKQSCESSFQGAVRSCQAEEPFKSRYSLYLEMKPLFLASANKGDTNSPSDALYRISRRDFLARNQSWRARLCDGAGADSADSKQPSVLGRSFCIEKVRPDIQKRLQYYHEIKTILVTRNDAPARGAAANQQDLNPTLLQREETLWEVIFAARNEHIAELLYILLIIGGLGELIVLLMKFFMPDRIKVYLLADGRK